MASMAAPDKKRKKSKKRARDEAAEAEGKAFDSELDALFTLSAADKVRLPVIAKPDAATKKRKTAAEAGEDSAVGDGGDGGDGGTSDEEGPVAASSRQAKLHNRKRRKLAASSASGASGAGDKPAHERDEEREARTVFVGNLPVATNVKGLKRLFRDCGTIETVRLRTVSLLQKQVSQKMVAVVKRQQHATESSSVNAYIVFSTLEEAQTALARNGEVFEGRHLRVDMASGTQYDHRRSVFIGNLPFDISEEALRAVLVGCGTVVAIRIVRDKETTLGKGIAFALFDSRESVPKALALSGVKLEQRKLRITRVQKPGAPKPHAKSPQRAAAGKKRDQSGKKRRAKGDGTRAARRAQAFQGLEAKPGVLPDEAKTALKQLKKSSHKTKVVTSGERKRKAALQDRQAAKQAKKRQAHSKKK